MGSNTSQEIFISKNTSFTDYSFSSPRIPGEGELLVLDNPCNAIRGLRDRVIIFAGRDDIYINQFAQLDVSGVLTETLKIQKLKTTTGQSAQSQSLTTNFGDSLAFITFEPALRILQDVANIAEPQIRTFSNPIKPDFDAEDFTNADMLFDGQRINIATTVNGKFYILEFKEDADGNIRRFWQPPQILPIRRLSIIDGSLHGHSNSVTESYKLFDGISDGFIAGSSVSTSATSPGTMADDDSVGTIAWNSPDNAKTSDNVRSSAVFTGTNQVSHYLKATNFGFSIPNGATIDGIKVEVEKRQSFGGTTVEDNKVRIVKGGSIGSTDKAEGGDWNAGTDATSTYGSSSDLWGETWTVSDINASNFGFVISAKNGAIAPDAEVDHILITVTYTNVDDKFPFRAVAAFAYNTYGERINMKSIDEYFTEGFISANTTLKLTLNYDFDGFTQTIEKTIDGSDSDIIFSSLSLGGLGNSPLGDVPLGGEAGSGDDVLPKFRIIHEIPRQDFFEIQAIYEIDDTDERFQILSHGPNALLSKNMPTQIKK